MKKSNRILSLCIALLFLCTSAFAYSDGTLTYLGAAPEGVGNNTIVTREILAYSLSSVLMPGGSFEQTATAFDDVGADNPYSGHISYIAARGIMNGSGDGLFNPKKEVTVNEVSKTLVSALGYGLMAEARGGWPGGYMTVASSLKLFTGADITGTNLTWSSLKTMLLNMLSCPVPDEIIYTEDGSLETALKTQRNAETFAQRNLDLFEYEATVTDIDFEKYRATVVMGEQQEGSRYTYGETLYFDVSTNINIAVYENVPAEIVIHDNKTIVDIAPQNGINIKYGVVDSVNNSVNDVSYSINHINALTLWDDETDYDFASGCTFIQDGRLVNDKINLVDEYVRIVEKDEEIMSVSRWSLTDGGKITKTSDSHLYYLSGTTERRIEKINEAIETTVIIDGEPRSYKELKEGMMFSYYQNKDEKSIVIIATEKRLSDVLGGINTSDSTLSLGSISVRYAPDVHSTTDGTKYSSGVNALLRLAESDVVAIFDIYGVARYVESYIPSAAAADFLVYVLGYKAETSFRGAEVRLACINDDGVPVKDFPVSDKVTLDGSTDISQLIAAAGNPDGSGIYTVEFNAKGEVREFKSVPRIEGFENIAAPSYWTFLDDGTPYLGFGKRRLYIPKTTPVISIRNANGEIEVSKLTYATLVGKSLSEESIPAADRTSVTFNYYSDDDRQDLRMIVMTGPVDSIPNSKKSGIVDRVGTALNSDGDAVPSVTVDGVTYALSQDNTIVPEKGELINYSESLFRPGEVTISSRFNFKEDISNWNGMAKGESTFRTGVVTKSSKSRIGITLDAEYMLSDSLIMAAGDEYFCYYEPGCKFYGIDSEGELVNLSYQDVVPGQQVAVLISRDKSYAADAIAEVYVRKD